MHKNVHLKCFDQFFHLLSYKSLMLTTEKELCTVYLFLNGSLSSKWRCVLSAVKLCKCIGVFLQFLFICVHALRSCGEWSPCWYAYPYANRPTREFFMCCFLRCSDDTFPLSGPFVGSAVLQRRGGAQGSVEQMPSCHGTKKPSVTLSSPLPPAFIGCASKWRSAYEKGPPSLCHAN